jgi:hypothetical protein
MKNKSFVEVTADTAINGFLGGIQLEVGALLAIATFGTDTTVLESGYKKLKNSAKGGYEMGRRIRKNLK